MLCTCEKIKIHVPLIKIPCPTSRHWITSIYTLYQIIMIVMKNDWLLLTGPWWGGQKETKVHQREKPGHEEMEIRESPNQNLIQSSSSFKEKIQCNNLQPFCQTNQKLPSFVVLGKRFSIRAQVKVILMDWHCHIHGSMVFQLVYGLGIWYFFVLVYGCMHFYAPEIVDCGAYCFCPVCHSFIL